MNSRNIFCSLILTVLLLSASRCPAPIKNESNNSEIKKYSSYNKKKKSSTSYKKKKSRFQFTEHEKLSGKTSFFDTPEKTKKKDYVIVIEHDPKNKYTKKSRKSKRKTKSSSSKRYSTKANKPVRTRQASRVVIETEPEKITTSLANPKL
jgi:hypothetical protein